MRGGPEYRLHDRLFLNTTSRRTRSRCLFTRETESLLSEFEYSERDAVPVHRVFWANKTTLTSSRTECNVTAVATVHALDHDLQQRASPQAMWRRASESKTWHVRHTRLLERGTSGTRPWSSPPVPRRRARPLTTALDRDLQQRAPPQETRTRSSQSKISTYVTPIYSNA